MSGEPTAGDAARIPCSAVTQSLSCWTKRGLQAGWGCSALSWGLLKSLSLLLGGRLGLEWPWAAADWLNQGDVGLGPMTAGR